MRLLRGSQSIFNFDAADKSRPNVTTMKARNFQGDIPSDAVDRFKDPYVQIFDLISLQVATGNCFSTELDG